MQALIYTRTGSLDVLQQRVIKTPVPDDNQVLIKVKACALNVSDYQRFQTKRGKIPFSTYMTNLMMGYIGKPLGTEIAGIVVKGGKNVIQVKEGDAVFGRTAGTAPAGGLAEFALMDRDHLCKKPDCLSFEEAAAICVSFETALGAVRKAHIQKEQEVMVHGASGGVGLYAVQLAKAAGAIVTGVCSTRNTELAKSAGCDCVIDYQKQDFTLSDTRYDVILGVNGCNLMIIYRNLLKEHGVFVGVGNINQATKALAASFTSHHFTYYASAFSRQYDSLSFAGKLAEEGKLHVFIDKIYPVADTTEALQYLLTEHAQGKVVIRTDFHS